MRISLRAAALLVAAISAFGLLIWLTPVDRARTLEQVCANPTFREMREQRCARENEVRNELPRRRAAEDELRLQQPSKTHDQF